MIIRRIGIRLTEIADAFDGRRTGIVLGGQIHGQVRITENDAELRKLHIVAARRTTRQKLAAAVAAAFGELAKP